MLWQSCTSVFVLRFPRVALVSGSVHSGWIRNELIAIQARCQAAGVVYWAVSLRMPDHGVVFNTASLTQWSNVLRANEHIEKLPLALPAYASVFDDALCFLTTAFVLVQHLCASAFKCL